MVGMDERRVRTKAEPPLSRLASSCVDQKTTEILHEKVNCLPNVIFVFKCFFFFFGLSLTSVILP